MPDFSPWDNIAAPSSDFNVRQVSTKTAVPCYWGRDFSNSCLFIIELKGEHAEQYRKNIIRVNGIDIDLRSEKNGLQRLILTLQKHVDRDIFESLCHTLVSSLEHATDSASSLAVSLAHLRRWKVFLAGRNQHLSIEEVRGLFAEITFLLELTDHKMPIKNAIEAWLGPDRSHQDFIFGNSAVEIKSLSGSERNTVRISSEDQLESLNDSLFLRIYKLSALADTADSHTLNEIISIVHSKLEDAESIEAFYQKLASYGYAPLPEYDHPSFSISGVLTYQVNSEFPRMIRSHLPIGIMNVVYDIKLESIMAYECNNKLIFEMS